MLPAQPRMSSPESALSPAGTVDSGRSFGSVDMGNRTRSGSVLSSKVRVQVTTDNESFTTVDITGMQTAEGIKERVFSKVRFVFPTASTLSIGLLKGIGRVVNAQLRFRDDEYTNLSLFRTDVDELPDSTPVNAEALLQMCQTMGDAKATLKFFVMHTVPTSAGANIVPPIPDAATARMSTDNLSLNPPARTPSRHSKDGSMSSASEMFDRGTSNSDWSEIAAEEAEGYSGSVSLVRRATTRSARQSREGPVPSRGLPTSASRSPLIEPTTGPTSPLPSPTRTLPSQPTLQPHQSPRKGSLTPTPDRQFNMSDSFAGPSQAGPSRAGPSSGAGLGLSLDEEMDEGTRALIAQLQAQEEEENAARRRQLEADEELARREQQQERNVWEMMQEIDAQNQRTRREQIEQDELRAVSPWQRFDGYANV